MLKIIGFISAGFLGGAGLIGIAPLIKSFEYMEVIWIVYNILSTIAFITLAVFIGMLAHKLK